MSYKRLVFSSVGDNARVDFGRKVTRAFDVCIAYYGNTNIREEAHADYFYPMKGFKIPNFLKCLDLNPNLLNYDYYFFIDDDLIISNETIEFIFEMAIKNDLKLCQPSVQFGSFIAWPGLLQKPGVLLEFVNFIEVQCFCIRKDFLLETMPFFKSTNSGFGLDLAWKEILRHERRSIGLIHSVSFFHPHKPNELSVRGVIADFNQQAATQIKELSKMLNIKLKRESILFFVRLRVYSRVYVDRSRFIAGLIGWYIRYAYCICAVLTVRLKNKIKRGLLRLI